MIEFDIERGPIALFARAVGDIGAGYPADATTARDDRRTPVTDPVIPLTYLASWSQFDPLSGSRPSQPPPVAQPNRASTVAAEAHFEYHRPIKIGDRLVVSVRNGMSWRKTGRHGVVRFTETVTDFRDQSGELVATIRRVSARTEPSGAGEGGNR